jgi:hypothetical protein
MAEIRHFPGFQATLESVARKVAPGGQPAPTNEKYCVYNQTRGRFVATSVEAVDASSGDQEVRLRSLELRSGAGLWLLPCPEISPTSIRFLVDLVYLNREGAVLAAVESFPLVNAAVSSAMAGSVLVLAEGTVAAGEIHIGDRLVVAAPDDMKRHLQALKEAKAAAQEAASSTLEQHPLPSPEAPAAGAAEIPESGRPHADPVSAQAPAHAQAPAQKSIAPPAAQPPVANITRVDVGATPTAFRPSEPAKADTLWAATGATEFAPYAPAKMSPDANEWVAAEPAHFAAKTPRGAFEALPTAVRQGAPIYQPPSPRYEPAPPAQVPAYSATPPIPGGEPPARQEPVPAPPSEAPAQRAGADEWKKKKPAKGWFAKLLNSEPEDPRITTRQSLPGLIAYYFTGGTPQPHAVRDISQTGMYIVTEERWYPGTVVRVTLTNRHNPTTERSITVNAKAVRAGSDGVGFEFVLEERDRSKIRPEEWMDQANGMYLDQVEEFLRVYKST